MRVVSGDGPGVYLLGVINVGGKPVCGGSVFVRAHRSWVSERDRGSSENSQGNQCLERLYALHRDPPVYIHRTPEGGYWIQK